MPEFLTLAPPWKAKNILLSILAERITIGADRYERIETKQALGRVTASDIAAPEDLPNFSRSTVDGYAVRAEDTYGASESLPVYLKSDGEVKMGSIATFEILPGTCGLIHTGGMLPGNANAVIMLEHAQIVKAEKGEQNQTKEDGQNQTVEIYKPAAIGENVIRIGEDVTTGEVVLHRGKRIRGQEIGGLMALGVLQIQVVKAPRVGLISNGDEVVPPDQPIRAGQVRDVNSYSLSALVEEAGGIPIRYGIVGDEKALLKERVCIALHDCEIVVITAGSSASVRDHTAEVIAEMGEPGVLVHGVNIRPGKPTILGVCGEKAVIGLPGNPVSALVSARLFVIPAIEAYLGVEKAKVKASIPARLAVNLASQAGRQDWVPVRIIPDKDSNSGDVQYLAEPVFGKSNLIFSLVRADGLIQIPEDATGLNAGTLVYVELI